MRGASKRRLDRARSAAVQISSSHVEVRVSHGALVLAALSAIAAAYLRKQRSASRSSASRPGPRTSLHRLDRPASPAVLGATPHRRLYSGFDLARAAAIEDLRIMAHRRLPTIALEYLEGGGDEEASLARNIEAFAEWYFIPSRLVDVSSRQIGTTLFGRQISMPLAIAPTGLNALFWPHADLALAEAAAEAGVPFIQSTMSNDRLERVAAVPNLRHWWQLYAFGRPSISASLIERARQAGCEALVVTADAQIYGHRGWDSRNRMAQPEYLSWRSYADVVLHPRWLASLMTNQGMPSFANVVEYLPEDKRGFFDSAFWIRSEMDQALAWDTLRRIRDLWPRKLLVKGVLNPENVVQAADMGADGVILSNHGGRQLDWSVSGLDVLQTARAAVGGRLTILVDGGIRRGTDILKALALGADAVLAGRAVLYGVAAAGRPGVARALQILRCELYRDLGLLGVSSLDALGPHVLARSGHKL